MNSDAESPCPSIDLFVELARLAEKFGAVAGKADTLRDSLIADSSTAADRDEPHLIAALRDLSGSAFALADLVEQNRVGIAIIQDDDAPSSHQPHLCLEHLEYLRTETTVVRGLDDPPRAHFRCKICGHELSRGGIYPSEISDPESEILANPS